MQVLVLHFRFLEELSKKMLKTTRNKMKKHKKTFTLVRGKLNSIESKISKALINSETCHEDFTTNINEENPIVNLKKH